MKHKSDRRRAGLAAQQPAERALKALHQRHLQEAWGHVVARLLTELPIAVPDDLVEKARVRDAFSNPRPIPQRSR